MNDNFGHLTGDFVLARLGKIAMSATRTEDIFARYGGEEFCILSRGVDLQKPGAWDQVPRQLV